MSHPQPQTYPVLRSRICAQVSATQRIFLLSLALLFASILLYIGTAAPQALADELAPEAPGSIAGIVRNPQGEPMAGISVSLYAFQNGFWIGRQTVRTDAGGRYQFVLLPVGIYRVGGSDPQRIYAQTYHPAAPTIDQSTDISVAGNQLTNIDLTMQLGGQIMGTITATAGLSITQSMVTLVQRNPQGGSNSWLALQTIYPVASSGFYSFTNLSANAYRICVRMDRNDYPLYECYDNVYEVSRATDLVVTAGTTISNVNITLGDQVDYAQISGRVLGPAQEPLADITVVALVLPPLTASASAQNATPLPPTATPIAPATPVFSLIPLYSYPLYSEYPPYYEYPYYGSYSTVTDSQGNYRLPRLGAGRYTLYFRDEANQYAFTYYNHTQIQAEATIFELVPKQSLTDVTIQLERGSSIRGTVTLLGQPAINTTVRVERKTPFGWQGITDILADATQGHYEISGLTAGTYRLLAYGTIYDGFTPYYYQGYFGGSTPESASEITLAVGESKQADMTLTGYEQFEGTLSGRVTAGGTPLAGAKVFLYYDGCCGSSSISQLTYVLTDAEGRYSVAGLAANRLRVRASDPVGIYATTYYTASRMPSTAQHVVVESGKTVSGIDIDLPPGGSISGRAVRRNGQPVAGLQVTLYAPGLYDLIDSSPTLPTDNLQTDADGRYTLKGLHPGEYYVCLKDPQRWMGECYGMIIGNMGPIRREQGLITVVAGATTNADILWGPDFTYYLPFVAQ